jgi:hypothetical protein
MVLFLNLDRIKLNEDLILAGNSFIADKLPVLLLL